MSKLKKAAFIDLFPHMPNMLKSNIISASFNRFGGVSPPPFNELNVGLAVGDSQENVDRNIKIIKKATGLKHIVSVKQVHSTDIFHLKNLDLPHFQDADCIVTDLTNVGLMIKHADCQAVSIFDPVKGVIANVHCGWRGSAKKILSKTIEFLKNVYGSRAEDLWAGISPSLGPCCSEFRDWKKMLPEWLHQFRINENHFDFWSASIQELKNMNVREENIYAAKICTKCNEDYFSYRREKITGRLATVIALKNS